MDASCQLRRAASFVLLLCACSHPGGGAPPERGAGPEGTQADASRECIVDTIMLADAVQLGEDLEAAIDPRFIVEIGPQAYPHARVPGALDAPLLPDDEHGAYVYSFHGWDLVPGELVDRPAGGLFATIGGAAPGAHTPAFDRQRYAVARALFEALSRAEETRTERQVEPTAGYDRSSTLVRRSTPGGRLFCDEISFTETGGEPNFTCVLDQVEWKTVQVLDPDRAGAFCPSF